ncbi:MAG: WYL domain-containing protein, partial [Polyangiaceae bacterium]
MAEIPKAKGSLPPAARGSIMAPRGSIPPARVSIPPVRGSGPPPAIKYTSRLPLRSRTPKLGRTAGQFTQFRRLDRLRETLESHPGGLSLEDLATMLHVTTRSVRRYLKELEHERQIESVPTAPGGAHLWRIKPSERGRALLLRRTQAYGLLATRRVFEMIRGSALFDEVDLVHRQLVLLAQRPAARAGVRGEIPSDQRLEERVVYVPSPPRNYTAKAEELDALFDAVANLRVVSVRYDGGAQPVTLHPYALFLHKGAIFCAGHEVEAKSTRVLSFDRMRGTSIV